jgi:hypothetical protein
MLTSSGVQAIEWPPKSRTEMPTVRDLLCGLVQREAERQDIPLDITLLPLEIVFMGMLSGVALAIFVRGRYRHGVKRLMRFDVSRQDSSLPAPIGPRGDVLSLPVHGPRRPVRPMPWRSRGRSFRARHPACWFSACSIARVAQAVSSTASRPAGAL